MIVALGGDGLMLSTLHATEGMAIPVYGMNRGTVGFLMNEYAEAGLRARLDAAEEAVINPLRMRATRADGEVIAALAINEVSILRAGPQAARLRILVDGRERLPELVADGALLCTPAGLDRLQLLGARPDPADRGRHPRPHAHGRLPPAALARRAAAEVGAGDLRGAGARQAPGLGGGRLGRGARRHPHRDRERAATSSTTSSSIPATASRSG